MGKAKKIVPKVEPEKVIRVVGENLSIELTEDEKKYRNRHGADDIADIPNDKLKCTVCAKSLADVLKKGVQPFVHMVLGVLMCKECCSFYGDGYFSVDEDGDDKYCRWCGQGGTLYLCSTCTCAFCKKCIKQNVDKNVLKDLESDDWKCLICKPKPLFDCRTVCWSLQQFAENKSGNESKEDVAVSSRASREKSRRSSEAGPSNANKRKVSEIDDDEDSESKSRKRRKKSGNALETEPSVKQTKSNPRPKRSRDLPAEEKETPPSKVTRSLRKNKERTSVEEITISDEEGKVAEDETENSFSKTTSKKQNNKRKSTQRTKKSTSKSPAKTEVKERAKRSSASTGNFQEGEGDRNSDKRSSRQSGKKTPKSEPEQKRVETKRASRKRPSPSESDDDTEANNESNFMTFNELNLSESESKQLKSHSKESLKTLINKKSKLSLVKNADDNVVQAAEFINSALKDVNELTVLISVHCDKLCRKSVQSSDDILNCFDKLNHLLNGAHISLDLIEKGLKTKISEWKEINNIKEPNDTKISTENESKNELHDDTCAKEINNIKEQNDTELSIDIGSGHRLDNDTCSKSVHESSAVNEDNELKNDKENFMNTDMENKESGLTDDTKQGGQGEELPLKPQSSSENMEIDHEEINKTEDEDNIKHMDKAEEKDFEEKEHHNKDEVLEGKCEEENSVDEQVEGKEHLKKSIHNCVDTLQNDESAEKVERHLQNHSEESEKEIVNNSNDNVSIEDTDESLKSSADKVSENKEDEENTITALSHDRDGYSEKTPLNAGEVTGEVDKSSNSEIDNLLETLDNGDKDKIDLDSKNCDDNDPEADEDKDNIDLDSKNCDDNDPEADEDKVSHETSNEVKNVIETKNDENADKDESEEKNLSDTEGRAIDDGKNCIFASSIKVRENGASKSNEASLQQESSITQQSIDSGSESQSQDERLLDFNLLETLEGKREALNDTSNTKLNSNKKDEDDKKEEYKTEDRNAEHGKETSSEAENKISSIADTTTNIVKTGSSLIEEEPTNSSVKEVVAKNEEKIESKSTENKIDIPKTPNEDSRKNEGSHHPHTPSPTFSSGEKSRYSQGSHQQQRYPHDRNRDYNQSRDRYQYRGGPHYRGYDDRWSNRGGWGWKR